MRYAICSQNIVLDLVSSMHEIASGNFVLFLAKGRRNFLLKKFILFGAYPTCTFCLEGMGHFSKVLNTSPFTLSLSTF